MRVTIMTPSRNKIVLDGVETVRDVKRQIAEKTGIPVRQQLVYFRRKQLKSLRRPLSAYNVRDDSTLFLVKRLSICRCLACRNSRYIEREEMAEERQLLRQLFGDPPDDSCQSPAEVPDGAGAENASAREVEGPLAAASSEHRERESPQQTLDTPGTPETQVSRANREPAMDNVEESDVEGVEEEEDVTEVEEDPVEEEEDDAEDVEEEVEDVVEGVAETGEEAEEENEETEEVEGADDGDGEDEAMEEREGTGDIEDATEETDDVEVVDEDLDLSGEEADDEDEHDTAEERDADLEAIEVEDIEDEQTGEADDEDDEAEGVQEDDDEDVTILYSLVTGREDNPNREELELATGAVEDIDEDNSPELIFARQATFEEDGTNSVGEENPDIAELEDEPLLAPEADPAGIIEDRVEDMLLAMTRPTPNLEDSDDPLEEPYPEDDPLFDPPDEDDPLLELRDEEDAGYISGDEMEQM